MSDVSLPEGALEGHASKGRTSSNELTPKGNTIAQLQAARALLADLYQCGNEGAKDEEGYQGNRRFSYRDALRASGREALQRVSQQGAIQQAPSWAVKSKSPMNQSEQSPMNQSQNLRRKLFMSQADMPMESHSPTYNVPREFSFLSPKTASTPPHLLENVPFHMKSPMLPMPMQRMPFIVPPTCSASSEGSRPGTPTTGTPPNSTPGTYSSMSPMSNNGLASFILPQAWNGMDLQELAARLKAAGDVVYED